MDQNTPAPQTPAEPQVTEAADNQTVISNVLADSGLLDSIEAPVEPQEPAPEAPVTEEVDPLAEFFEQAEESDKSGEFPEGTPEWVPGRIAREKRKADQLRTENESLQQEVERLRQMQTAPAVSGIPGIQTETDLLQYEKTANDTNRLLSRWIRDYDRNPDQVAEQIKSEAGYDITQEVDPVGWLYAKQDQIVEQLDTTVPAARKRFEQSRQVEQVIASQFPQYTDTESQFRKQIDAWIGEDPTLKSSPVAPALAAYAIIGKKVMEARQKKTAPSTPAPTAQPAPVREQPAQKPRQNQQAEERQEALNSRKGIRNLLGGLARELKPS